MTLSRSVPWRTARPIAVIAALILILAAVPAMATSHHKRHHHRMRCVTHTDHRSRRRNGRLVIVLEPICLSSQTLYASKHQAKPTPPANLAAAPGNAEVNLSWGSSTASGSTIAGYRVYRNHTQVAQVPTTTFTDTGLVNGASYSYYTIGYTSSGTVSPASNTVSATPLDTTAPTAPSGLTTSGLSSSGVSLSWSPSTDSSGVAGYNVYLGSTNVATTTQTTYTFTGLTCGTTYTVGVSASDAAGNTSSITTSALTTTGCPPVNTSAPSISGTPVQGATLTASTGTWTNSPNSYAYQWQDCASTVCTNISGATGSTSTLQATDVGDTVKIVVTANNTTGSGSATSPATASVTAPNAGSPALFDRVTYQYSSSLSVSQEAADYQVMVMQSTDSTTAQQLLAANPKLKVLMYQESIVSSSSDPTGLTTCTAYNTDNNNATAHPGNPQYDWFLKDQSGNRVLQSGYSDRYLMDVGNTYYQTACAAHAIALAHTDGFNGVFFDDIGPYLTDYTSTTIPEYSTQSGWDTAELSLTSYLGPQLHGISPALTVMANVGHTNSNSTSTFWQDATTPLDGSMEESFTDGGLGPAQQDPYWTTTIAHLAWSEAHNKYVLLHSYSTTEAGNRYGLASMLLVADGYSSYSTSNNCYTSCETWVPEYNTAQQLGVPTAGYTHLSNGAYERQYTNGIVLANPTTNTIPTFALGGTYTGSGLTSTTTASLSPNTGLVLLKTN